jgi:hypothetical protein
MNFPRRTSNIKKHVHVSMQRVFMLGSFYIQQILKPHFPRIFGEFNQTSAFGQHWLSAYQNNREPLLSKSPDSNESKGYCLVEKHFEVCTSDNILDFVDISETNCDVGCHMTSN